MSELFNAGAERQCIREYEKLRLLKRNPPPVEVVIHKDTAGVYKRLAKKGMMCLYYTPNPPQKIYLFWKNFDTSIICEEEHVRCVENCPGTKNKLKEEFEDMEKYKIPIEKIDDIFKLINQGTEPSKIAEILKS